MTWTRSARHGDLRNVHTRVTTGQIERAGALLDRIAEPGNPVWPADRWPALVLDGGQRPGSLGGHGAVRYRVSSATAGREVTFEFVEGSGLTGRHTFTVEPMGRDQVRWGHELIIEKPTVLTRTLVIPLHDQLLEDLLDGAEAAMVRQPLRRRPWPPRVRLLLAAERAVVREPTSADRERPRTPAHLTATALAGLGVLHAVWATGATWPARNRKGLRAAVMDDAALPGAAPTVAVASALLAAAGLAELRAHPDHPVTRHLAFGVIDLGVRLAAGVLAARGLVGLALSGTRGMATQYRKLDVAAYSPLCLALATGLAHTAGVLGRHQTRHASRTTLSWQCRGSRSKRPNAFGHDRAR